MEKRILNRAIPYRKCFESTINPCGKSYTGIGSRSGMSDLIKYTAIKLGYYLALEGYILRSGGAEGMDDFFEAGADLAMIQDENAQKQIFLPKSFTWGNPSVWSTPSEEALKTVEIFHKYGKNIKDFNKLLMGRNAHQVLGPNLDDKAKFVICWTPDGCISDKDRTYGGTGGTGGTGQAISIADKYEVPIFNLAIPEHLERINKKIKVWEEKYGECPDVEILKTGIPKNKLKKMKM